MRGVNGLHHLTAIADPAQENLEREGVLVELATDGQGFAVGEDAAPPHAPQSAEREPVRRASSEP